MKLAALLLVFATTLSQTVQAKVYTFGLFDDDTAQPFEIIIDTGNSKTDIQRLLIRESVKNITFFDIPKTGLNISRNGNVVTIQDNIPKLTCLNKVEYINYYGDATLKRGHAYGIELVMNLKNGEYHNGEMTVADGEVQEMAMWGSLVLKR